MRYYRLGWVGRFTRFRSFFFVLDIMRFTALEIDIWITLHAERVSWLLLLDGLGRGVGVGVLDCDCQVQGDRRHDWLNS